MSRKTSSTGPAFVGLLPEELDFSVRPRYLLQAVEGLPAPKGRRKKGRLKVHELRDKLMEVPVKNLSKWKMKASAQEALPYLAAEQGNPDLQKRVAALSLAALPDMRLSLLARLLPFLVFDASVRRAALKRFRGSPPKEPLPAWLVGHWKDALSSDTPALHLAKSVYRSRLSIAGVLQAIGLPASTPLGERFMHRYYAMLTDRDLKSQPFMETVEMIRSSGLPAEIRHGMLRWMLNSYVGGPRGTAASGAASWLLDVAVGEWGSHKRSAWNGLPSEVLRAAREAWIRKELCRLLGERDPLRRSDWWMCRLHQIKDVTTHPPSGLVAIDLGALLAVESLVEPARLRLFPGRGFREQWQATRWQSMPLHLPDADYEMFRKAGWQAELDNVFSQTGWVVE
jgi:hypothetical protein